jgi:hypothetical protein
MLQRFCLARKDKRSIIGIQVKTLEATDENSGSKVRLSSHRNLPLFVMVHLGGGTAILYSGSSLPVQA